MNSPNSPQRRELSKDESAHFDSLYAAERAARDAFDRHAIAGRNKARAVTLLEESFMRARRSIALGDD